MGKNVLLPGGLFHNGSCIRDVVLTAPSGKVEENLADLNGGSLASAVTILLSHCIESIGTITQITPEIVKNLLVGDRDYLVLNLRQITYSDKVDAAIKCPNEECREKFDIDFNLSDIPLKQGHVSTEIFSLQLPKGTKPKTQNTNNCFHVEFRLPSGGDQEDLAALMNKNETEAENKLLKRCIQRIDGDAEIDKYLSILSKPSAKRKIEKAMAEHAPQLDLNMEITCPECEKAFILPFNISQFFIDELKINLNQLYREVHFLAFYYNWSEEEILAMPRKKRYKYLEFLNEYTGTHQ